MQRKVRVVSQEEYNAWVKEQGTYVTDDLRKQFNLPVAVPAPAAPAATDSTATTNQIALK